MFSRARLHVMGMLWFMSFDIKQPSLPAPFYSVLVSVSVFMALSTISFLKLSRQLSVFWLCSSSLISALLVLLSTYLFAKVSLSPDIILCGWLGLKHELTFAANWLIANELDWFCRFFPPGRGGGGRTVEFDSGGRNDIFSWMISYLVGWCFKPSQPQGIISGLILLMVELFPYQTSQHDRFYSAIDGRRKEVDRGHVRQTIAGRRGTS